MIARLITAYRDRRAVARATNILLAEVHGPSGWDRLDFDRRTVTA